MHANKNLKTMYRNIHADLFPRHMEISFGDDQRRQTLLYEKVEWVVEGERKGLRYGENPDQEAALYRLVNGNLSLGETECIQPGRHLASDMELLRSGKHPGKINVTDTDSALNILRYFSDSPATVIVKHNNPCGVARAETLTDAFRNAFLADRLAAFGGVIACNQPVDVETATLIAAQYFEVVVAPDFTEEALTLLGKRKNLRVLRIRNMERLSTYVAERVLDFTSLIDGGIVVQWSYVPRLFDKNDLIRPRVERDGEVHEIERFPSNREFEDMKFGWLVESGVTSNSVLFVKDGVTVAIGSGEQDRVGAAIIARDKAYRKYADRLAWERYGSPYHLLEADADRRAIDEDTHEARGGLRGSVMVSDAFFPFRDGADVGLREGVTAILQPGGSVRDYEVIDACNEYGATMMFTGQRSFKH